MRALVIAFFLGLGLSVSALAQLSQPPSLQACGALPTEDQRLNCVNDLAAKKGDRFGAALRGGWRVAKVLNPATGRSSTTITRTAETKSSDIGFAGLMYRCGASRPETLLVLIEPVSPSSKPIVTIANNGNGKPQQFSAEVLQSGTLLRLPDAALDAAPLWAALPELSLEIKTPQTTVRGTVPTAGLTSALEVLKASCTSQ